MEYFDILPVEISLHIFSLLPIECVLDCALVSKSWKSLIHSPSFYKMHEERHLHFAIETASEIIQERKKFNELLVPARQLIQTCQSIEQLQQIEKLVNEGENLVKKLPVLVEKANNSIRLAKKCSEICVEYNVLGKSPFKAGGRNQSTAKTLGLSEKTDGVMSYVVPWCCFVLLLGACLNLCHHIPFYGVPPG